VPRSHAGDGIYLLANDRFLEWARALLSSLALHEPGLPVTVIPYDDSAARVIDLARAAGHNLFEGAELLTRLDQLAQDTFAPAPGWVGAYRKLAAFSGPYERFLVLDADSVLTAPVRPVLEALGADCQVYPAQHSSPLQVWSAGGEQPVFNSGIWAAQGGLLDEGDVASLASEAAAVRDRFASRGDQSFFNFCLVQRGLRARAWSEDASGPLVQWAGDLAGSGARGLPLRTSMVHWAGYRLTPMMPCRRLWLEQRLRRAPVAERAGYLAREPGRLVAEAARRLGAATGVREY
jgi:hypothetical protein